MTVANVFMMPTSDFVSVMGMWALGVLLVVGTMLMLAWRDQAQGR